MKSQIKDIAQSIVKIIVVKIGIHGGELGFRFANWCFYKFPWLKGA